MLVKMRKFAFAIVLFILFSTLFVRSDGDDSEEEDKPSEKWKKKDIRNYNDADMERLFDQWEEDEEKDPDDLMEHERPAPKIDLSKMDPKNPESILQMSKTGKTLMMFVTVSGEPNQEEAEKITQRWQDQLFNANFQLQRYMVDSNRAIFLLKDGSKAWEIKNFLISQERCYEVTIDNKSYYGKGSGKKTNEKGEPLDGEEDKKGKKSKDKNKTGKGKNKKTADAGNVKVAGAKRASKVEDNKTEL